MGQAHHAATTWASGTVLTAARLNNLEAQYTEAVANFPSPQIGLFYRNGDVSVSANYDQTVVWTKETDDAAAYSLSGAYVILPGAGLYTCLFRTTWADFAATGKTGLGTIEVYDSTPTLKATPDMRGLQSTSGFAMSALQRATFYIHSAITGPRLLVTVRNTNSPGGATLTGGLTATWLHVIRWNQA